MNIEPQEYLDFSQVLLKPKRSTLSSRKEANLLRTFVLPHATISLTGTPIMGSNMDSVSTFEAAKALNKHQLYSVLHKHYPAYRYIEFFKDPLNWDLNFYSMGISDSDLEKYIEVSRQLDHFPNVCVDIANGYSEKFVGFISRLRDKVGSSTAIMAGNVATPEIVEELILKGADIVKVGIGSGSVCTTRSVTGVGVPQFSCAIDCSIAAHGVKGLICSDGGITCPGDVVKALGAGADFVMVGSEFAAHDENIPRTWIKGEKVSVYGMSSSTAMNKHNGGVSDYRASEGRTASIPYRGELESTIKYYLGGLRSGMTYIGAEHIKDISKRATFIKVQNTINTTLSKYTDTIR